MTTASDAVVEDLAPNGILRASINLGNPVLAQGTPEAPAGVTVDLAREVGARLGVPVELLTFDAARTSYAAMVEGRAELCFLAVDPAREAAVSFTPPYVVIEGVYMVASDSDLDAVADVDRAGIRIGVKEGSAGDPLRRDPPRSPDRRGALHADPAGGRHDPQPPARHRRVPPGPPRGAEG